jgi:hypothetical protein
MGAVGLRSISTLLLVALLLPLFLPLLIPVAHAQTENNVFADNFEGYQVGSFPSAGGWEIVWDGMGQSYQVISTSYSYSPTRSFQLWGRTGWSSVVQKRFSADSPIIGYELSILIDERGSGYTDHPAFFCKDCATWGAYYGTVNFDHGDGKIKAEDGTVLGSWSPRTWYRVKVVLDRQTNKYSVWINGELRGQNIPTSRSDTDKINAIALVSGWPGKKVYYDDVRVFTVTQPPDTIPPTVRVIAPNGGETLFPGNVFRIRWEASDNVGVAKVHIWLFQGNEQVMVIARDLPNTGYYDWTVPNRPGTNYRIRIVAVDAAGNAGYDDSDGTFEIGGEVRVSAQIVSLTTDKNQYNPGETVRIRYTIRNTGDVRIELRMVVEIVDPSGRSVYDSHRLGQDRRHDLDPGQTASGEFTWTIPADAVPGTYEVRASLRHWNIWDIVFDYRWGDRPGPRFTVQAAATATLQVGIRHTYIGDLKIWVGVEGGREVLIWNREGGGTRDLFKEWNLLQLGFTVNDLPPSESKRWYLRIRDEAGGDEGRLEYFRIIYQGRTYESQDRPEIKDFQEVRAWIPSRGAPSLPDLTVRDVSFSPQTVTRGGSITVSWTEVNIGSGNAGPYRVGIYLGVSEYGRDHLLGSFNRDGLAAGDSKRYTQTFIIPSSVPPGGYYVTVFIDDLRAVSETNEENNIGSSTPNRLQVQQAQTPSEEIRLRKSLIYVLGPFELSEGSSRSYVFRKPPFLTAQPPFINLEDFLVETVTVIIRVQGLEPGEVISGRVAVWVVNRHREATFRAVGSECTRYSHVITLYVDARNLFYPNSLDRIELELAAERGSVTINEVIIIAEGEFIASGPY